MYVSLSLTLSGVCVEVPSNLDIASICLVMSDDSQISRRNIHRIPTHIERPLRRTNVSAFRDFMPPGPHF